MGAAAACRRADVVAAGGTPDERELTAGTASVAAACGWTDLELGHGFHETKQGVRYTISEAARREILDCLLELNHRRHAQEQTDTVPRTKKPSGSKRRSASHKNLSLEY